MKDIEEILPAPRFIKDLFQNQGILFLERAKRHRALNIAGQVDVKLIKQLVGVWKVVRTNCTLQLSRAL